jgi:hypothetical protein
MDPQFEESLKLLMKLPTLSPTKEYYDKIIFPKLLGDRIRRKKIVE